MAKMVIALVNIYSEISHKCEDKFLLFIFSFERSDFKLVPGGQLCRQWLLKHNVFLSTYMNYEIEKCLKY